MKRIPLQFRLWHVLMILTCVACLLAFSVNTKERCKRQQAFVEKHDCLILYSHQLTSVSTDPLSPNEVEDIRENGLKGGPQWPGPARLRQFLGDEAFANVAQAYVFRKNGNRPTVGEFGELPTLKLLEINGWNLLSNVEGFERLKQLEVLKIRPCYNLEDYNPIAELEQLKRLQLVGCSRMTRPQFGRLNQLEHLSIQGCPLLEDITSLSSLENLETLIITSCYALEDFSAIKDLSQLKHINLSRAPRLRNLDFVKALSHLKVLNISECNNLENLEILFDLKQLEILDVSGCTNIDEENVVELRQKLPKTRVKHQY